MVESDNLRYTKMALNNGSGAISALGFGTLIPDPMATRTATKAALEAGFRLLDAAERYRNEKEVGEAMQEVFKAGKIKREEVFVATKLWNTNHRPERVRPAFEASLKKLQVDYVDLYLQSRRKARFLFEVGAESPLGRSVYTQRLAAGSSRPSPNPPYPFPSNGLSRD